VINDFIEQFTYLGIFMALFLGGLGVPIPEELPVLAAGALAHEGYMRWWVALPVCLFGVLAGDSVLYWVGHHWGERILDWSIVRRVLTAPREHVLLGAYRRHAAKTIFTARHVMGLRAAAFLTAGIARVPFWKFILVDAAAAAIGVPTGFSLAYFFTDQLGEILHDVHRVERWVTLVGLVVLATWIAVLAWRKSRAVAQDVDDGVL
jgi:membrane protein DedA with SNARE-associated domain